MNALHKRLLVTTLIAGLGISASALAGHEPMGDCPMMERGAGGRAWKDDDLKLHHALMQQRRAERMELLAARLKLTQAQESAWKAFLDAQNAHHEAKFKARQEIRDKDETASEHFRERLHVMEQQVATMKDLVKAADDLYAVLDPPQKQVMDKFFTERHGPLGKGQGPKAEAGPTH